MIKEPERKNRKLKVSKEELENYWYTDMSNVEIAQKLNCSMSYLGVLKLVYDLPRRSMKKRSRWTKEEVEKYWYEPISTVELASRLGCSPANISILRKRFGLPHRGGTRAIPREVLEKVQQCETIDEAMKKTGKSRMSIYYLMQRYNIKLSRKREKTQQREEKLIEYAKAGLKHVQMAHLLSIDPSVISKMLKKLKAQGRLDNQRAGSVE